MIFGIDFDGTLAEHRFPAIGEEVPGAFDTLHALVASGHKLILWTMRSDKTLFDAVQWCAERGISFWGVNHNPEQTWSNSPKAYCHVYIDDAAFGCPLIKISGERPFVDWAAIQKALRSEKVIP